MPDPQEARGAACPRAAALPKPSPPSLTFMKTWASGAVVTPSSPLRKATTPSSTRLAQASASGSARCMWAQAPRDQIRPRWKASKADRPCLWSDSNSRK
eukprot:6235692-Pyramimonas_sp.AAC.1